MNKLLTRAGAIILVLTFFLAVPAKAQEFQFNPGLWKRKATQVRLTMANGDTVSGLLVYVDKEGVMVLPDAEYLTPIPGQYWDPQYILRDSISLVFQDLRLHHEGKGWAIGLSFTGIAAIQGYIALNELGMVVYGIYGALVGAIVGPWTAFIIKRKEHLSAVIEAKDPIQWKVFVNNSRRNTLVSPNNFEPLMALKSQITSDTASWESLMKVSPVIQRMYGPSAYTWGLEARWALTNSDLPFAENKYRQRYERKWVVNLAATYTLTSAWRIEGGVGRRKRDKRLSYYNWLANGWYRVSGNALNTRIQGDFGYLLGKWHQNLAKSPFRVVVGGGFGLERVQYDVFASENSIPLLGGYEPDGGPFSSSVEDYFTSNNFHPAIITSAELGYARSNWEIFLGYYTHWLPKLDRPGYTWNHFRYEEDVPIPRSLEVAAAKEVLSWAYLHVGFRFCFQ